MSRVFKSLCIKAPIIILILFSCGNSNNNLEPLTTNTDKIVTIKFDPEGAIELPFDSLFKSFEILELLWPENSNSKGLGIHSTDSFIIIIASNNYMVFDRKGRFINITGSKGEGPNDNRSLGFYYADNESIVSICDTKWIKYNLKGTTISKGRLEYSIFPHSFIPLNDSTWLFYQCHLSSQSNLRLWTTDLNFKIKKEYLLPNSNFPTGGSGFMKFIHQTSNGIYITDRVIDTIYRFTEIGVDPIYVFDIGNYINHRTFEARKLYQDEVLCTIKLVSANSILFKVVVNEQYYFIYHNRLTNATKTIKTITNGPDLMNTWILRNSDKEDRLYWVPNTLNLPLIDDNAIKFGYADLLERSKELGVEANPFFLITTLR